MRSSPRSQEDSPRSYTAWMRPLMSSQISAHNSRVGMPSARGCFTPSVGR